MSRQVRKTIFSHDLWFPQRQRPQEFRRRLAREVNTQSADRAQSTDSSSRSIRYGLLNACSIGNKSTIIHNVIAERRLDVLLLTETWHTSHDDVALCRCVPYGFTHVDVPRPSDGSRQNHGGVAAVVTDRVACRVIAPPRLFTRFESVCFSVTDAGQTVVNLLLYRPGSVAVTDTFFTELTLYLEVLALYKCQIIIAGDFNIHTELNDDPNATRLADIMFSFDCVQHVPIVPTHNEGGTIHLVFTKSEQMVHDMLVNPPGAISDHGLIHWRLPALIQPTITASRDIRR